MVKKAVEIMKNNKQWIREDKDIPDLEAEFNKWRPFGYEKDFELSDFCTHRPGVESICGVLRITSKEHFHRVDLKHIVSKEMILLCKKCIQKYINAFMEYRKEHNLPIPED
ncbi:hypothetical protein ES702_02620 [subsurface metagenome]